MLVSIIIPCINEIENLSRLLPELSQQNLENMEVIVSDGGSSDGSLELLNKFGCKYIESAKGRAKQMNTAANVAQGEILLFLHADTKFFAKHTLQNAISTFLSKRTTKPKLGHFSIEFYNKGNKDSLTYRFHEKKSQLSRINTTNGDQGILIYKKDFSSFDETYHFLEDQEFIERFRKSGEVFWLSESIGTSARRFETQGIKKTFLLMSMIMACFSCGGDIFLHKSKSIYRDHNNTEKFLLYPFLALAWNLFVVNLKTKSLTLQFYRFGKYMGENSWQIFFWLDVNIIYGTSTKKYFFLRIYDRFLYPIFNNTITYVFYGFFIFTWFMLILRVYYYFTEIMLARQK